MIQLAPIKEGPSDYDAIERQIRQHLKRQIYDPLVAILGESVYRRTNNSLVYSNAKKPTVLDAIRTGQIQFHRGAFRGRFSAAISKELKALGAQWDQKTGTFKLPQSSLPGDLRQAISTSLAQFEQKLAAMDRHLAKIVPEELADQLKVAPHFDRTIFKVEQKFQRSVRNITVAPKLSSKTRARIAEEWQNNMQLSIKDFTEKEIRELRRRMQTLVFSGKRYEQAVSMIARSYGTSLAKAKFLARQETGLLMAKLKANRYQDAGVKEYKWRCVAGTPLHPVRPAHKKLADQSDKGKVFRWDDPPNTAEPDQAPRYNNPGEDFNCRCFAVPVIRSKKGR